MKITLVNNNNETLEQIKVKTRTRFILYRGRLFEQMEHSTIYMQQSYLEVS